MSTEAEQGHIWLLHGACAMLSDHRYNVRLSVAECGTEACVYQGISGYTKLQ